MSFAKEVKEEIISHEFNHQQTRHLLAGFIKYNGELVYANTGFFLKLTSNSNAIIRRIYSLLKVIYTGRIQISILQTQMITKKKVYELVLTDKVEEFLVKNNLYDFQNNDKIIKVNINNDDEESTLTRSYISGIFVAVGSVNSPETSNYHLEFQFKDEESANYIAELLVSFEFNFKVIQKKNKYICYIKKSTLVSDFLKLIDASKSVLKFENIRISRDLANSVNRVVNIEIYNQQKSSSTGQKQVKLINTIIEKKLFAELSEKAQSLCDLRLKNPEASFSELEMMMNEKGIIITKSGVSNLFRIITKLAESIGE